MALKALQIEQKQTMYVCRTLAKQFQIILKFIGGKWFIYLGGFVTRNAFVIDLYNKSLKIKFSQQTRFIIS